MSETTSHDDGLEVQVWLRCESTEELWRFAQALPDPADGSKRIPPPEGRRNMVCTWPVPDDLPAEDPPEPWTDAQLYGAAQAEILIRLAAGLGIDMYVYAMRVQPVDAEFEGLVPATSGEDALTRADLVPASRAQALYAALGNLVDALGGEDEAEPDASVISEAVDAACAVLGVERAA